MIAADTFELTVPTTPAGLEDFAATLGSSLGGLLPELVLVIGIVGLLLARFFTRGHGVPGTVALGVVVLAGAGAILGLGRPPVEDAFFGMIRADALASVIKLLVL